MDKRKDDDQEAQHYNQREAEEGEGGSFGFGYNRPAAADDKVPAATAAVSMERTASRMPSSAGVSLPFASFRVLLLEGAIPRARYFSMHAIRCLLTEK